MATAKGVVVVTGANGGLGSAIVEEITSKPKLSVFHGIYTVRDTTAAPTLTYALARGTSSHPHDVLSLDLTKLDNVRQVAEGINVSHLIGLYRLFPLVILAWTKHRCLKRR